MLGKNSGMENKVVFQPLRPENITESMVDKVLEKVNKTGEPMTRDQARELILFMRKEIKSHEHGITNPSSEIFEA